MPDQDDHSTKKRENIEINNFLRKRRKICECMKNTEMIFLKITQTLFIY